MAHNINKVMIAFKKAKSTLDKVIEMVEENKYCIDIIQQNLSVIGLLRSANSSLLEGHIDNCIKESCKKGSPKDINDKMEELIKVMKIAQSK